MHAGLGTKQELHDTTERIPNSSTSTAGMTNIPSLLDKESIPLPGVYDQKASGITRDQGKNYLQNNYYIISNDF